MIVSLAGIFDTNARNVNEKAEHVLLVKNVPT
jgi:hypothetical protein